MPSLVRTTAFFSALAQALAGVAFTNNVFNVSPGQPFTLTWDSSNQKGPVTIRLMTGPSDDLKPVETLTTSGSDGTFTWTPPSSIPSGKYAFQITDQSSDKPNYSIQFNYTSDVAAVSAVNNDNTTTAAPMPSPTDDDDTDDEDDNGDVDGPDDPDDLDDDDDDDDDTDDEDDGTPATTAEPAGSTTVEAGALAISPGRLVLAGTAMAIAAGALAFM